MSEQRISLAEGDTLIINVPMQVKPEIPPPELPENELEVLINIDGVNIYEKVDGSYVGFVSDLDICNDGTGPSHGDQSHQAQTAYYNGGKFLNADVDKYIVIPPQVRKMTKGVVMGCKAQLTNLVTGVTHPAVTGDIGPDDISGEAAYCLAKIINPTVGHNTGDKDRHYMYELWPDVPAVVGNKTYKLEPA